MVPLVSFRVAGLAATQGSKTAIATRGGKIVLREGKTKEAAERLADWRHAVGFEARRAAGVVAPTSGPVVIDLQFTMRRPAAHYGSGRNRDKLKPSAPAWPIGRGSGDVDKFARAAMDALTGVIFNDDGQVIELRVTKRYGPPGARVTIWGETALEEVAG